MRKVLVAVGLAVAAGVSLSACAGGGFSAACKAGINDSIDLRARTVQLSGGASAPCAGGGSEELVAACQDLKTSLADLKSQCADSYGDALDATLLGSRQ